MSYPHTVIYAVIVVSFSTYSAVLSVLILKTCAMEQSHHNYVFLRHIRTYISYNLRACRKFGTNKGEFKLQGGNRFVALVTLQYIL